MKLILLVVAGLIFLTSCSEHSLSPPINDTSFKSLEEIRPGTDVFSRDLRSHGCTPYPPNIVRALVQDNEVEILESNSDFFNHIYLVSPVEMFIAVDDKTGKIVPLPPVTPGTELIFEIRVHFPMDTPLGMAWQSGPGTRNADGAVHALIEKCPTRTYIVNFEDLDASGWGAADEPNYVDAVFAVRPQ